MHRSSRRDSQLRRQPTTSARVVPSSPRGDASTGENGDRRARAIPLTDGIPRAPPSRRWRGASADQAQGRIGERIRKTNRRDGAWRILARSSIGSMRGTTHEGAPPTTRAAPPAVLFWQAVDGERSHRFIKTSARNSMDKRMWSRQLRAGSAVDAASPRSRTRPIAGPNDGQPRRTGGCRATSCIGGGLREVAPFNAARTAIPGRSGCLTAQRTRDTLVVTVGR